VNPFGGTTYDVLAVAQDEDTLILSRCLALDRKQALPDRFQFHLVVGRRLKAA
jgi:hypothetical protein